MYNSTGLQSLLKFSRRTTLSFKQQLVFFLLKMVPSRRSKKAKAEIKSNLIVTISSFLNFPYTDSFLWSSFFVVPLCIAAPAQRPRRSHRNGLMWYYSKQRERTGGRGGVDGLRRPRQVAGSPASEPPVGVRPPRGAKLPARLPQPHLGQGKRRGRAAGSTPVHPALSLTQHSSYD